MRANVFLPHVLDAWCVKDVHPRRQGRWFLRRCADDCSIGWEREADAGRIREVLPQRFTRFRLPMPPEQMALRACKRPPRHNQSAGGTGTGDFLGCPHSWGQTRQGYWVSKRKPVGKRLRRCRQESWPGCRAHRHAPLQEQDRPLCAKRRGDDQYYGRRGHCKRRAVVVEPTERAGPSWRSTRRHKGHIHWRQFAGVLWQQRPLPKPRSLHHIEQGQGQQR